jgi:hypothetical protein
METIPSLEWATLILDTPSAYRWPQNSVKNEPWINIRVEIADVQKPRQPKINSSSINMMLSIFCCFTTTYWDLKKVLPKRSTLQQPRRRFHENGSVAEMMELARQYGR